MSWCVALIDIEEHDGLVESYWESEGQDLHKYSHTIHSRRLGSGIHYAVTQPTDIA